MSYSTRHSSILAQEHRNKESPGQPHALAFQFVHQSSSSSSSNAGSLLLRSSLRQQRNAFRASGGVQHHSSNNSSSSSVNPLQAFAVLSGSRLFGIRHEGSIRHTFNKIDVDQKGHITEADLAAFAEANSLPMTYVRPFLDAVLQHQQEQQQEQQLQGLTGIALQHHQHQQHDTEEDEVSFDAFRAFVQARESGLRQAFESFDIDGDGRISPEDLCCSLSRVAICCPGGCVLRPRRQVVAELMHRLNVDGGRRLTFPEFRSFFMLLPQQDQLVEYWLSGPAALSCADMGCHFSIQETNRQRKGSPWGHLLAGAVAGAASRTATAPLETLRLAAMAGRLPAGMSLWGAGQQLVATGGLRALYQGNVVNVLRSAPARAVDFFAFDLFKTWVGSDTYPKTFAAAGLAGTFSWVLLYPLEVVRSRLTLSSGTYSGIGHCVSSMLAKEGPRAFYRGLGASVAAIAPEAAITYGLHDLLKRSYRNMHHREAGVVPSLVCGVIAAWSGQMVAFPLETISRRMQLAGVAAAAGGAAGATAMATAPVSATAAAAGAASVAAAGAAAAAGGGATGGAGGGGILRVLASVLKEGGPGALYRGLGAATLRLVPSAMISFGAYELIQKLWLELEAKQDVQLARTHYQQLHAALSTAQKCNQQIQQLQQQGLSAELGCMDAASSSTGCLPCQLDQPALSALSSSSCGAYSGASSDSSHGAEGTAAASAGIPCGMLVCSSGCAAAVSDCTSSSSSNSAPAPALGAAPAAAAGAPCSTNSTAATACGSSHDDSKAHPVAACGVCVLSPAGSNSVGGAPKGS